MELSDLSIDQKLLEGDQLPQKMSIEVDTNDIWQFHKIEKITYDTYVYHFKS